MIEKTCDLCGAKFFVYPYRADSAHFCSQECYNKYRKREAYKPRVCPNCGKKFTPNRKTRDNKYCSKKCSILGRRKYKIEGEEIKWKDKEKGQISKWRGEKRCLYCGEKFKYTSKNIHQKYCSNLCAVRSRAYDIDETFFSQIDSEGKAYLLGLIFADGSISQDSNEINISSKDRGLIETCKKLLKTEAPIHHYKNNFCLVFCNEKIYRSLRKWGILPRKSWKDYCLPKLPKRLMWHFLRGFLDGDGSFYIDDRGKWKYLCVSFSCGSKKFLKQIKKYIEKIDEIQTQKIRFDRKSDNTGSWQLRMGRKKAVKKFTEYLYKDSNYFLGRKYEIVKTFYEEQI